MTTITKAALLPTQTGPTSVAFPHPQCGKNGSFYGRQYQPQTPSAYEPPACDQEGLTVREVREEPKDKDKDKDKDKERKTSTKTNEKRKSPRAEVDGQVATSICATDQDALSRLKALCLDRRAEWKRQGNKNVSIKMAEDQLRIWKARWKIVAARKTDVDMLVCEVFDSKPALSFTVNFSKLVEKRVLKHDCPADYVKRRINKSLRTANIAGLPYLFVCDWSDQKRIHIHGMALPEDRDPMAVEAALKAAGGGEIKRQLHTKELYSAVGYLKYSSKSLDNIASAIGEKKLVFISQSLNRLAKEHHQIQREIIGEKAC